MKKLLLSLLFLASPLLATGPLYVSPNASDQSEHENLYKELRFPKISTGTAQNFYIRNGSATLNGLAIGSGGTVSGISGRILQTAQATTTSVFSTTSSAFQTSNLSVSITPLFSSSKVLVVASFVTQVNSAALGATSIFRGTTNLGDTTYGLQICHTATVALLRCSTTLSYLDSPSTTSATTYAVKIHNDDGVTTVAVGYAGLTEQQTITAMEISQ